LRSRKHLVWPGPGLLLVLALTLPACSTKEKVPEAALQGDANAVPVEVARVESKQLSVTKTYSGPLEGEEQANIIARLSERVTGVKVRVGDAVEAGQLIVALDKSGPSSQYFQAEANFKNAEKTLERMKSLFTEGAISQQSLDGAQTAYDVARANFTSARSSVELTTPIAGVLTAVNVSEGDLASPGASLATIAKVGRMKVIFNINETDVPNLSVGQSVVVYSDTRPETKMDGRIILLSKSADSRSRSFEIKALFPNTPDRWFKPGMYCKATLAISSREKMPSVPNAALLSDGTTNRVFVILNGYSFEREVRVGVSDGVSTAILQGLRVGDTVATVGVNNLKDSTRVTVVNR
jgi:membrane fusion protein, multidrug efflux system